MLARLGRVLYWIGCSFAALFAIGAVVAIVANRASDDSWIMFIAMVAVAAAVWSVGRACRYVLASE
jgi:hypothetical protein